MTRDPLLPAVLRAIQNRVDWPTRAALGSALAETLSQQHPPGEAGADPAALAGLRKAGIAPAPVRIEAGQCAEVVDYFTRTSCHAAHVPAYSDGGARPVAEVAKASTYGSYTLADSLRAPHVAELALHPGMLALAAAYLGCLPSLYSINTFWTFPVGKPGLSHEFHRDEDDYRFMVVFIYWTAVEPGEGEFYFIEGTHDPEAVAQRLREVGRLARQVSWRPFVRIRTADDLRRLNGGNGYGYDELYARLFGGQVRRVDGPAGTAIAADTFALHRGTPPRSRPRLVTWIRYGLYENDAYKTDGTRPLPSSIVGGRVPGDALTRRVSRLVLDWP